MTCRELLKTGSTIAPPPKKKNSVTNVSWLLDTRKGATKEKRLHPCSCFAKDYRTTTPGWQWAPHVKETGPGAGFKTGDFVNRNVGWGGATVSGLPYRGVTVPGGFRTGGLPHRKTTLLKWLGTSEDTMVGAPLPHDVPKRNNEISQFCILGPLMVFQPTGLHSSWREINGFKATQLKV